MQSVAYLPNTKVNSLGLSHNDVEGLNYLETCNSLNSNAVLLTRHFQYRVEIFSKEMLLIGSGPLRKVKYYAIRVKSFNLGVHHIDIVFCGY